MSDTRLTMVADTIYRLIGHLDNYDQVNILGGMLAGLFSTIEDPEMRRQHLDETFRQIRERCQVTIQ